MILVEFAKQVKRLTSNFFFRRTVRQISIRGRLAIGLHCFASACKCRGLLEHPEIQLFLDHMWRLIGPDGANFVEWEQANPLLVNTGLGYETPPGFSAFLASKSVTEVDFRELLSNLVEVVYWNAYGATDNGKTLEYLMATVESACRWGGKCPEPNRFEKSRWADKYGWGNNLSATELAEWRCSAEEI